MRSACTASRVVGLHPPRGLPVPRGPGMPVASIDSDAFSCYDRGQSEEEGMLKQSSLTKELSQHV